MSKKVLVLRRQRVALRQVEYFAGYHGKAVPLFIGTCRFDGGLQCQDIGLEGYALVRLEMLNIRQFSETERSQMREAMTLMVRRQFAELRGK